MTHAASRRDRLRVQGKGKQYAWLAGGLAAAGAGIAIAPTLAFGHQGGDPGGIRQSTLRSISVALPGDAHVGNHSAGGPIWDSCDGRSGTQGWSDVSNHYEFTSARSAATVIAGAEASMKIAGWMLTSTSTSTSTTPLGPLTVWTKAVSDNVVAKATLSVGTRGPNSASYWNLDALAPPAGRRVSGC
jgi:hypothetical protein